MPISEEDFRKLQEKVDYLMKTEGQNPDTVTDKKLKYMERKVGKKPENFDEKIKQDVEDFTKKKVTFFVSILFMSASISALSVFSYTYYRTKDFGKALGEVRKTFMPMITPRFMRSLIDTKTRIDNGEI